ncbi:hypothetical protein ACI65C_006645 [Semiaphis heraclei]
MEHQGYIYVKNGSKRNKTKYYKCKESSKYLCRGSIKIVKRNNVQVIRRHNHDPDQNFLSLHNFKKSLKTRSVNENTPLNILYEQEARRNPEVAAHYSWKSTESLMRLSRKRSLPNVPETLKDLADQFDAGLLHRFQACGEIIYKEYTFSLCSNGEENRRGYDAVLHYIKHNLLPEFRPTVILTDFEAALRTELIRHFPTAAAHGCWYHINQVYEAVENQVPQLLDIPNGEALNRMDDEAVKNQVHHERRNIFDVSDDEVVDLDQETVADMNDKAVENQVHHERRNIFDVSDEEVVDLDQETVADMNENEEDYYTPEDRDPDMIVMMEQEARQRQLDMDNIPFVRIPPVLPSLENQHQLCIICTVEERTHALIPCDHKIICEDCLHRLEPKRCPLCNDYFTGSLRIFLS